MNKFISYVFTCCSVVTVILSIIYLLYVVMIDPEKINSTTLAIAIGTMFITSSLIQSKLNNKTPEVKTIILTKDESLIMSTCRKKQLYSVKISKTSIRKKEILNANVKERRVLTLEIELENINDETIFLSGDNFSIYDKSGAQLSTYPFFNNQNLTMKISTGRHGTFQSAYTLNNESNDIEIEYFPDNTYKKPVAIWKLSVAS